MQSVVVFTEENDITIYRTNFSQQCYGLQFFVTYNYIYLIVIKLFSIYKYQYMYGRLFLYKDILPN